MTNFPLHGLFSLYPPQNAGIDNSGLYYVVKTKALISYHAADLRLCFRICINRVFHDVAHIKVANCSCLQRLRMEMEEITAQQYLHEKTMKVKQKSR